MAKVKKLENEGSCSDLKNRKKYKFLNGLKIEVFSFYFSYLSFVFLRLFLAFILFSSNVILKTKKNIFFSPLPNLIISLSLPSLQYFAQKLFSLQQIQANPTLIQYLFMNNLSLLVICVLLFHTTFSQIQVILDNTDATLYSNNKIRLKFFVKGTAGPYFIRYNSIPTSWETFGDDLIITNVTKDAVQNWTFDINITDSERKNLYQTIKMVINKFQIMLYPVTIAQTKNSSFSKNSQQQGSSFNLDSIIDRYPGMNKNEYATSSLVASSIITPQLIATSQAQYIPERDSKQISPLEMRKIAVEQRQINANKAISNLLSIINKLNNVIADSKNKQQKEQKTMKQMKDSSFECSEVLFKLQDKQVKIKNAIEDKKTKQAQEKTQIQQTSQVIQKLRDELRGLQEEKLVIEKTVNPEGISLIEGEKKIAQCQIIITNTTEQLENISNNMKNNILEINIMINNIDDSNQKLFRINTSLDIVRDKIADLRKQLKEAQEQQINLVKDQSSYLYVPMVSKIKITNLERKNQELGNQSKELTQRVVGVKKVCDSLKNDISKKKESIISRQQNYSLILLKIQQLKNRTSFLEKQIKDRAANSDLLMLQLSALDKQMSNNSRLLTNQRYICGVAQEKKTKQQARIDELSILIDKSSNSLLQATNTLEIARVEKQLADQAFNQIMLQMANVTRFSSPITGGDLKLGGSPLGNNPSGQALGPAFRVQSVEKGEAIKVDNLTYFLSSMYGMNIDPTEILNILSKQAKSINQMTKLTATLYKLDNQSKVQLYKNPQDVNDPFNISSRCDVEDQSKVETKKGIIELVSLGSIIVRDEVGQKITLSVNPCTKILSTIPLNAFESGNKIEFTGTELYSLLNNLIFDVHTILIGR